MNPGLTKQEFIGILEKAAKSKTHDDWDLGYKYGLLMAIRVAKQLAEPSPAPCEQSVKAQVSGKQTSKAEQEELARARSVLSTTFIPDANFMDKPLPDSLQFTGDAFNPSIAKE